MLSHIIAIASIFKRGFSTSVCACLSVPLRMHTCLCMNMGICIYVCMHACMCLPVCVCVGILPCVEKQPLFLHLHLNVGVQVLVCNLSHLSHCSGTVTPILCPAHTSYRVFGPHPPNEFPYFSNGHFLLNASWSLGLSKSTCQNINFIHPQHTAHTHTRMSTAEREDTADLKLLL